MSTAACDVLVIGGGLVGAAVAWGVARAGATVCVLDEGDDAIRASRGNFGLVWVQGKGDGMPDYAAWTRDSAGRWLELAAIIGEQDGIDVALRQPGGLEPCISEAEWVERELQVRRMHNQPGVGGNDVRMISAAEARELEPALGPEVVGASYCPHDGHVNPLFLLRGLHAGLARHGVDHRLDHWVESVRPDGDGFAVRTAHGTLRAGRVVLAAGLGNVRLGPLVGLDVPTEAERGHILVTERLDPVLSHPMGRLRQTEEGTVMIGASADRVGLDTSLDLATAAALAARARRVVPALGRARLVRSWAALRIMSPDGFPIYAESENHPGAFVVTCHSGVTLAAVHALYLAPSMLQPGFNDRYAAFHPRRFGGAEAA
ncbi:MAG: FAD-binding oxidoreductase [Alphaproteobacteria bacterium]|nr:FAD-binding oxidoreductase [Alphaproteobacteria bacterium]